MSADLTGSQATTGCGSGLSGTIAIGPTGIYPSLTAAITALNTNGLGGAAILELQPAYLSNVETFPIVLGFFGCNSTTNSLTIRPQSGATGLSITSANTTATLDLNGANNVIIDGRPGGTGTAVDLKIINTSTSGVAIRLINEASNNSLAYLDIQGQNTASPATGTVASAGVVYYSNESLGYSSAMSINA